MVSFFFFLISEVIRLLHFKSNLKEKKKNTADNEVYINVFL